MRKNAGFKMLANYEVMSTSDLKTIETEKYSITDCFYQIEYNKAFVTIFKDRTATLFPGAGRGEGIFFNNLEELNRMTKSRVFPAKGDNSFWEKEKDRVLDFQNAIPAYCAKLSSAIGVEVKITNASVYLDELSKVITQQLSGQQHAPNVLNYLAVYIAELIRRKAGGKWKFTPVYTLNVYYIPEIVYQREFCTPWRTIFGQLEMASFMPVDLAKLIDDAGRFYAVGARTYASL